LPSPFRRWCVLLRLELALIVCADLSFVRAMRTHSSRSPSFPLGFPPAKSSRHPLRDAEALIVCTRQRQKTSWPPARVECSLSNLRWAIHEEVHNPSIFLIPAFSLIHEILPVGHAFANSPASSYPILSKSAFDISFFETPARIEIAWCSFRGCRTQQTLYTGSTSSFLYVVVPLPDRDEASAGLWHAIACARGGA
jgi:hypothetical protein